ncbi:MAG TPA: SpoIID/LytB domain-containing protein [Gaiellaceae bacterium]|nr:SpoIID/LytB domain-containing protein [Gaiellaceae bacterium]
MLRRSLLLSALAALIAAGSAAAETEKRSGAVCTGTCYAAPAGSGALLVFTGHGWGHGVGMSQYGAYGYALHGWNYQQILAHYYPGTKLGMAPTSPIRVLLADKKKTLKISSPVPFTFTDGTGAAHSLPAGPLALDAGLTVNGQPLIAPLTFTAGAGGSLTLGRAYRGQIEVDVVDGRLRAIDIVGLEQYLYGVVPSEMPSTWSPEALKAQALAARSYALATRQVAAPFDVYSDTRSQMYLGISQETPATTSAVDATKGQVVLFGKTIATTFFFSTSGGETASSLDVWGTALPYLIPVSDPYDSISPFHDWGPVPVTAAQLAKTLKLQGAGPITDATTTLNASGRVASIDVLTQPSFSPVPTSTLLSSSTVAAALGLRSTWFGISLMSLSPPLTGTLVTYGSSVQLSGKIRGLAGVALEQRVAPGAWFSAGSVAPAADGSVQLLETPVVTTDYRLATPQAAAAYVRIRVAPNLQVTTVSSTGVQGSEQPPLPGTPISVQQLQPDQTWLTVASGTISSDGTFTIAASLLAGSTYRVVFAPGQGYAPATTLPLIAVG